MKLSCYTILWLTALPTASCFAPPLISSRPRAGVVLSVTEDEDYDAWLEQLDPSAFEESEEDRRGRSGGRDGGFARHDYERDWRADRSNVDEDAVDGLIAERLQARKVGQFDKADRLRDELLEVHGVSVWDKERLWRSGCSASGSGGKWGRGGGNRRDNNRRGGDDRRGGGRGQRRPPQNFGPNGHDYSLAADAGPSTSRLSEGEIHDLLAERLQCKLARNFRVADEIQNELYQNGVFVHDGFKEWRADGVGFSEDNSRGGGGYGGKPGRSSGSRADLNRPYEMSQFSAPLLEQADLSPEEYQEAVEDLKARIQDLIDERIEAKMERDYRTADGIRDDLRQDFNVAVDDRRREWSVGGLFEPPPGPYEISQFSLPIASLVEDAEEDDEQAIQNKIQSMVGERVEAKLNRDYNVADAIREDLYDMYKVAVDDRSRQWSVGGNFQPPPEPYRKSPYSMELTGIDEAQVVDMIQERDDARKQRAYAIADDIKFSLLEEHNIAISDNLKQWSVGGQFEDGPQRINNHGPPSLLTGYIRRGGGEVTPEEFEQIESMLEERAGYKASKNFGAADRIRDDLMAKFNIRLDDRNKEWHIVTDSYVQARSGHDLSSQDIDFIQEKINQRALAKLQADYETADNIRDSLMEQFAVSIDDRLKEWTVVVDPRNRVANPGPGTEDSFETGVADYVEDGYNSENEVSEVEEADNIYEEEEEVGEFEEEEDGDSEDLESLTVVELKEKLRAKGLPLSGRKAELIERLR